MMILFIWWKTCGRRKAFTAIADKSWKESYKKTDSSYISGKEASGLATTQASSAAAACNRRLHNQKRADQCLVSRCILSGKANLCGESSCRAQSSAVAGVNAIFAEKYTGGTSICQSRAEKPEQYLLGETAADSCDYLSGVD